MNEEDDHHHFVSHPAVFFVSDVTVQRVWLGDSLISL